MSTQTMQNQPQIDTLEAIARHYLLVDTLTVRNSDRLDFHEVGVVGIQRALQAAFEAGQRAAGLTAMSETQAPLCIKNKAR